MFVVTNIRIKFQKNVIPVKIKRITVGYQDKYLKNKKKYHQIDTHTFEWNEDITLPIYYNVPIQFICQVNQLETNPQEAKTALRCFIKIIDYKKDEENGVVLNNLNQKIATLFLSYKVINERLMIPDNKGYIAISSVLAHLDNHYGSKGFIEIARGKRQIFTPTIKVIAGELLWAEELQLPIYQSNHQNLLKEEIKFKVTVDQKLIGVGVVEFQSMKKVSQKYRKIQIWQSSNQRKKIGTLFIDIVFKGKQFKEAKATSESLDKLTLHMKRNQQTMLDKKHMSQRSLIEPEKTILHTNKENKSIIEKVQSQKLLSNLSLIKNAQKSLLTEDVGSHKKSKKAKNYDLFQGVFNMGEAQKEQESIRQILRQRRKRKEGVLPKIK